MKRNKATKQVEQLFYVYRLTNKVNGKMYVGISKNIIRRWQSYLQSSRGKKDYYVQPVVHAMRKYGADNFLFEIIEFGVPESKISERERYWISFHNTCMPNGYNVSPGGFDGGGHRISTRWNGVVYGSRKEAARAAHMRYLDMLVAVEQGQTEDPFPDDHIHLNDEIEAVFFPDFDKS